MMNESSNARDVVEAEGTVTAVHRGDVYRVEWAIGALRRESLCRRSGKLNQNHIKIVAGDRVKVELGIYDMTRGRIVYRVG